MLKKAVFLIALGIVGWNAYEFAWPLIDTHGVVENGSYRGLKIGETRAEVLSDLSSWTSRLKFDAYVVDGETYFLPSLNPNADTFPPFSASNKWWVLHPGFKRELITLEFTNDRLHTIEYSRGLENP